MIIHFDPLFNSNNPPPPPPYKETILCLVSAAAQQSHHPFPPSPPPPPVTSAPPPDQMKRLITNANCYKLWFKKYWNGLILNRSLEKEEQMTRDQSLSHYKIFR